MSTQVFPTLSGLTYDVQRTMEFSNQVQQSISGKETRINYWASARYTWTLQFSFLRSSTSFSEFQNLWGFMSARQGRYDSFLYTDSEDYTTTGQSLGVGDSTDRTWQLLRAFGGSSAQIEPMLAPNTVTKISVAGSSISSTQFTVGQWGSTAPGVITFSTFAPSNGQSIMADFSYYFPVRFDEDVGTFVNFMSKLWENKKLVLKSIK
jgi:uncharacterized protein (TIGR02217 family)